LTRTFVSADHGGLVTGYYTLLATEVRHVDSTVAIARGAPRRFPIPACLLARLAVDQMHQGQGLGSLLLLDAFGRVLAASEQIGIRALIVDAIDDSAVSFYERFSFESLAPGQRHLQMPLEAIRSRLSAPQ
jgi:GNAT superfamily N-acetyltransferase